MTTKELYIKINSLIKQHDEIVAELKEDHLFNFDKVFVEGNLSIDFIGQDELGYAEEEKYLHAKKIEEEIRHYEAQILRQESDKHVKRGGNNG